MQLSDLSPEAMAFANALERDDAPTDFSQIADVRKATQSAFAPGAERAIVRHALHREDCTVAGIECERIRSRHTGTSVGTLVYFFGGGFVVGCPHSDLPIIGALAEAVHVDVVAPKYRLAPEYPAPGASEDCLAVYRAIADSCAGRLLLAGESAGGNLALLTAQRALRDEIRAPDAMALLSPAVDLRREDELYAPTLELDPTLSPERRVDVDTAYVANCDPVDPFISPIFGSMHGLPPTIITTGTRDMLMAMCLRLDRKMKRAGVTVDTHVWNGLWHVFEYYDDYPEAAESLRSVSNFLTKAGL